MNISPPYKLIIRSLLSTLQVQHVGTKLCNRSDKKNKIKHKDNIPTEILLVLVSLIKNTSM